MDILELRGKINEIDAQLLELYKKRIEVSSDIAAYKKANGKPIYDGQREREHLAEIGEMAGDEYESGARILFSMLMELSRAKQKELIRPSQEFADAIEQALENTPNLFPDKAIVACQGVEGAYSQLACERLFAAPSIMFFDNFANVFNAIERGMCKYGILPIENSAAGSVNQIYDLMISHKFHIVRSVRVQVNHLLVSNPGAELKNIREIFSHEQALAQCSHFLRDLGPNVKITACENTAIAAKRVAESGRTDIAAISSKHSTEQYGLHTVASRIQNTDSNFTRFICISKDLEIYPGSDRTSIMAYIANKPGSLYKVLARFYSLGINLIKIESRPIPGRNFEFMFYFDIESPIYSPALKTLLCELNDESEGFTYLGSYHEII